jgi:hypothetical protein
MATQTRTIRPFALVAAPVLAAAVAGLLAAFPQMTRADDSATTYICHPATGGATANAEMKNTSTALVCHAVSLELHMSSGKMRVIGTVTSKPASSPDFSNALTPAQVNDAWAHYVMTTFNVEHSP